MGINTLRKGDYMKYYHAIHLAIKAHKGQIRKLEGTIYVAHPIEVGFILSEYKLDYDVIIAGILHDTIEDTYVSYEILKEYFGKTVADLVKEVSENDKTLPWDIRKKAAVDYLSNKASLNAKYIICADKLSNIRSMYNSINMKKNPEYSNIWNSFNAGYKKQKWYYEETIKNLEELKELSMYKELIDIKNKIF